MFLFLFYRIIERLLKIRPESLIGFLMFYFFSKYFKIFQKIELKKYNDKRTLWGLFRFDHKFHWTFNELTENINSSVNCGKICFENSMETSIRGINLIYIFSKNKSLYQKNKSFFNTYLKLCKSHVVLCPDLYLKRSGIRFRDESNNHRFYNLLFLQYYNFFFSKEIELKNLAEFLDFRLINNEFYDEGSSFYHYGIVDSLQKFLNFIKKIKDQNIPENFNLTVNKLSKNKNIFEKLNFGDRDGTTIMGESNNDILNNQFYINNSKFFLINNIDKYLFLRKKNWTDFGTEGHIHDDSGMVLISNGKNFIYDLGTFKYNLEPKYCNSKYHNFPNVKYIPKIKFKSKFVRIPEKNVTLINGIDLISISKSTNDLKITREYNKKKESINDFVISNKNIEINIKWKFYLSNNCKIKCDQKSDFNILKISNFCEFVLEPSSMFNIKNTIYFPDYNLKKNCKVLNISLKKMIISNKKTSILQFKQLFNTNY